MYCCTRDVMGVQNLSTWCHEMMHAADHRVQGSLKPGQDASQEIVAELGSAILLTLLGRVNDADLGGCWEYCKSYAKNNDVATITACQRLLERTCKAVALLLDTAANLQTV